MILEHCVKAGNVVELRKILRTSSLETLDETDKVCVKDYNYPIFS